MEYSNARHRGESSGSQTNGVYSDVHGGGANGALTKYTKACKKCRTQKLKCQPGSTGVHHPCQRCQETDSKCIPVEAQRPAPQPSLTERLTGHERVVEELQASVRELQYRLFSTNHRLDNLERKPQRRHSQNQISYPNTDQPGFASLPQIQETGVDNDMSYTQTNGRHDESSLQDLLNDATLNGNQVHPNTSSSVDSPSPRHTERGHDKIEPETAIHELEQGDLDSAAVKTLQGARVHHRTNSDSPRSAGKRRRLDGAVQDGRNLAFQIFVSRCLSSVCWFDNEDPGFSLGSSRAQSELLYWSIIAVGAREAPEMRELYLESEERAVSLLRETLFGEVPTFWDLCGALVYTKWLAPLRPLGHIVDLAYALDVHRAFDSVKNMLDPLPEQVEHVRVWVQVGCLDLIVSLTAGRPCHIVDREHMLRQAKWLVTLSTAKARDYRLLASYEFSQITHSIQDFLNDPQDVLTSAGHVRVQEREAAIDEWYTRWLPIADGFSRAAEVYTMSAATKVNYNLAKLFLNSFALKGLKHVDDITPLMMKYIRQSVRYARAQLELCVREFQPPVINYITEQVHVTFSSAAVFLLKVARLLPLFFDTAANLTLVSEVIKLLEHVSGKSHARILGYMLRRVQTQLSESPTANPIQMLQSASNPTVSGNQAPMMDNQIVSQNSFNINAPSFLLGGGYLPVPYPAVGADGVGIMNVDLNVPQSGAATSIPTGGTDSQMLAWAESIGAGTLWSWDLGGDGGGMLFQDASGMTM